jgi:ferrous iron transport protein B
MNNPQNVDTDCSTSLVGSNPQDRSLLIALAGHPNVGKSTLFNLFTGLNQHVGNWPGKTVERKEGSFTTNQHTYRLVDLPGTYSLTANSAEEVISREFIIREHPDVVLALVNAATLELNLYLVAELVVLPAPVIVVLNMMDVAQQEGLYIEPEVLQAALGVPVIPIIATRNLGVQALLRTIDRVASGEARYTPKLPEIREDHQDIFEEIRGLVTSNIPAPYRQDWIALKLMEGDKEITQLMAEYLPAENWEAVHGILRDHDDSLVAVAGGRYQWIGRMVRAAVIRPHIGRVSLTDRLDQWATHPFWGFLILAGILGLTFWLTYAIGAPLQEFLDKRIVSELGDLARQWLSGGPGWLSGLVADGIINGAGSVLTFLPILVIFFAVMGVLEDVGYMSRAAYVMDGFMHPIGLHGKSFLPLFLGFGCNVPGVLGTRVIESQRARLLTNFLVPLIPCTARMAVVAFLAPAFFGASAALVSWGLILGALIVLALSGVLINRTVFGGRRAAFIMELPLYHIPNWRTIGLLVWQRSWSFVRKAGTLIVLVSVVVWALSMVPNGNVDTGVLAYIGHLLEPVGRLAGLDWRLMVALLTSFIAKENTIASLGVIFSSAEGQGLAETLAATYTPTTALAFLTVQMLFIPCFATCAVVRQETNSWRWTFFNLGFLLVISLTMGAIVYWLANGISMVLSSV